MVTRALSLGSPWTSASRVQQEAVQFGEFGGGELAERLGQDSFDDLRPSSMDLLAVRGEAVPDRAPRAGDALDEVTLDHARRERAHRLVGLEGQLGEGVQRGVRLLSEVPQHVPLHERY